MPWNSSNFVAKLHQAIKALKANQVYQDWWRSNSIWFKSINSNNDSNDSNDYNTVLYDAVVNGWIKRSTGKNFIGDLNDDNFSTANIVRFTKIT